MIQLELFTEQDSRTPYWRKRLAEWPCDVLSSRHEPDSSGWSMATQGLKFAIWLFKANAMGTREYRRWCRFNRRVRRWDRKGMK